MSVPPNHHRRRRRRQTPNFTPEKRLNMSHSHASLPEEAIMAFGSASLPTHRRSAPRRAGPSSGKSVLETRRHEAEKGAVAAAATQTRLFSPSPGLMVSTRSPTLSSFGAIVTTAPQCERKLAAWSRGRAGVDVGRAATTHRGNLLQTVYCVHLSMQT